MNDIVKIQLVFFKQRTSENILLEFRCTNGQKGLSESLKKHCLVVSSQKIPPSESGAIGGQDRGGEGGPLISLLT